MSTPSLVVFDLAGTTIEDHAVVADCLVAALASVSAAITRQDANLVMGLPKPSAIAELLARAFGLTAPEPLESARVVHATRAFENAILRHYASPGTILPVVGAADTFETLQEYGSRVAIDTGFSAAVADLILSRLGWIAEGLVDVRVSSDEVPRGRPAPDMILEAMRRVNVTDIRAVAKVGDTPADLKEGANAGCGWNIGVTYGTHSRPELVDHPHTALIDDLRDLPVVLGLGGYSEPPQRTAAPRRSRARRVSSAR